MKPRPSPHKHRKTLDMLWPHSSVFCPQRTKKRTANNMLGTKYLSYDLFEKSANSRWWKLLWRWCVLGIVMCLFHHFCLFWKQEYKTCFPACPSVAYILYKAVQHGIKMPNTHITTTTSTILDLLIFQKAKLSSNLLHNMKTVFIFTH